jgi:hypothetical protein
MLLVHAGGNFGFPTSYLGVTDSNRATIEGQNDVMMKTPTARQKEFRALIEDIVRYALEGVTGANPALYRGVDAGFSVRMPEIAAKDVARIGTTINQIVQANDMAIANHTVSRRAAIAIQTAVVKHLGIELNPADLEAEIDEERVEEEAAAIAAAKTRQAAGLEPGTPTPDPGTPAPKRTTKAATTTDVIEAVDTAIAGLESRLGARVDAGLARISERVGLVAQ